MKIFHKNTLLLLITLQLFIGCEPSPIHGENGMVVSTSRHASKVGIDIMKMGGNAVDAAVAVGFALAVTSSSNGNIGGGGFMVAHLNNGNAFTLDYREMAPSKAHRDFYLDENKDVIENKSLFGHFASGVPGSVDGLLMAWEDHGSGMISRKQLLAPAIKLAQDGFDLSEHEAKRFNYNKKFFSKHPETKRIFTRDDQEWTKGDIFYQKDLAETLKRIAKDGRDGFYRGKTAELIVDEMKKVGGWISLDDLENYKAKYRQPVKGKFSDYDIISMGPPSSGGLLLVHMLNMLSEVMDKSKSRSIDLSYNSSDYIHVLTEIERRAYADRSEHLGDSDYWDVPRKMFLSKSYAKTRADGIDFNQATASNEIKYGNNEFTESEETTHYSVVDKNGNAVSVTTTINSGYGSGVTITGAGFLMNNEMDDFSIKPGVPNLFGLLGNEANAIKPGKRPLSSMTPTIVLKQDKPYLILGTPGGATIITTVFQNIINVIEHDMNILEAITSPRFHSQWFPDVIYYEKNSLSSSIIENLTSRGHQMKIRGDIGEANGILIDEKGYWGAPDPRGETSAIGY